MVNLPFDGARGWHGVEGGEGGWKGICIVGQWSLKELKLWNSCVLQDIEIFAVAMLLLCCCYVVAVIVAIVVSAVVAAVVAIVVAIVVAMVLSILLIGLLCCC